MKKLIFIQALIYSNITLASFNTLKSGFKTISTNYLMPLAAAIGGCSLLLYILMSYFESEKYQKKLINVVVLSICAAVGIEVLNQIIQAFGGQV